MPMTIFGIFITYAVCWWLVLFMVLPWGVTLDKTPVPGNAPSAPARPNLRKKLIITSALTLIPTAVLYLVISDAKAKESPGYRDPEIYHTSGAGTGCKPATIANDSAEVPVDINVPISPYMANPQNSPQGSIGLGKGVVKADGNLELGGKRVGAPQETGECP